MCLNKQSVITEDIVVIKCTHSDCVTFWYSYVFVRLLTKLPIKGRVSDLGNTLIHFLALS